jgi:hypothetical protein
MKRAAAALVLAGTCALQPVLPASAQKKPTPTVSDAGTFDASGRYQLSEAEQKLDCKKLNGRVRMRLLQLRAELSDKSRPTGAAQALQTVTNPAVKLMFGGASSYGTDRASQLARDRAVIEGYNQQLVAKNCQAYDVAAELRKTSGDPAPTPIAKPVAAKK